MFQGRLCCGLNSILSSSLVFRILIFVLRGDCSRFHQTQNSSFSISKTKEAATNFENVSLGKAPKYFETTFVEGHFHYIDEVKVQIQNHSLQRVWIRLPRDIHINFDLKPSESLWDENAVYVVKDGADQNSLKVHHQYIKNCHYKSVTVGIVASVSNCDGFLDGIVIFQHHTFIINNAQIRSNNETNVEGGEPSSVDLAWPGAKSVDTNELFENHGRIRRSTDEKQKSFCGAKVEKPQEIVNALETAAVYDSSGWIWWKNLVMEIAVFIDQNLWQRYLNKHGYNAYTHLQDFVSTTLNNVQIFYQHSSLSPKVSFKVVRFEVLKTQPDELRGFSDAENYLTAFCRYQSRWGGRNWDHAILFTGVDLVRYQTDYSISGIAKVSGVCDPFNSCLVAEAMDFRAAFITAHEIGHGLGIQHDEYFTCGSSFIMSESLGGGKVVWSSCSVNEFQKFLNLLNNQNRNCMLVQNQRAVLDIQTQPLPGQTYDGNRQCQMVYGKDYMEFKGRYSPGMAGDVCHMMWCHHRHGGNLLSSHPALEGTSCGFGYHCISGKCIIATNVPKPVHGQWSTWSEPNCEACQCSTLISGLATAKSVRSCNSPTPANGGRTCDGKSVMGQVCNKNACLSTVDHQSTLEDYLNLKCAQAKSKTNNVNLLGTGAQLLYSDDKACKIFCNLQAPPGVKNFRFFGDYLPNGSPCGRDKYCLDGHCLHLSCDDRTLLSDEVPCPEKSKNCLHTSTANPTSAPATSRVTWTGWSQWSVCSASCGSGFKTRTRQCYEIKTYRASTFCYGHEAEKEQCKVNDCPVIATTVMKKSISTAWSGTYGKYSLWSEWGYCSVTCGEGTQYRHRACYYSDKCRGEKKQYRPCFPKHCTAWGGWGYWSSCGFDRRRRRVRKCYGDLQYDMCPGPDIDTQYC